MRNRSYVRASVIGNLALLGALLVSALSAPSAQAAAFTVGLRGDARDLVPGNGRCDTSVESGIQCTLRAAIQETNARGERDTIRFDIGRPGTVKTITPARELPEITDSVTIDGYTQPGASVNTQATGDNAALLIELDGSRVPSEETGGRGLKISSDGSVIRGLVINDFVVGIELLAGVGNRLVGNFIGTDPAGTAGEGNAYNIHLADSSSTLIGGATPAARNIVADSALTGIVLNSSSGTRIVGNYIGTARDGVADLGNGHNAIGWDAIVVQRGSTGNRIGGTTAAAANIIAFTGGAGVAVVGDGSTGNAILGNSIHHSTHMGIDIADYGVTANDPLDLDIGANLRQNHPVITDAERVAFFGTAIEGRLNSAATTTFTVQFFSNPANEAIDEGQRFLGQTKVTTDAAGNASFAVSFETGNLTGAFVTATATDPAGNTSEFSPGRVVEPPSTDDAS